MHNSLLLYNERIVVPQALQGGTMACIHEGHQGIERCRMRAKNSVWWPGMSKALTEMVTNCPICVKASAVHKEPLMPTPLPDYPWQVVGSHLFSLKGDQYLVVGGR